MKQLTLFIFLLGLIYQGFSQQKIKVKKIDNRFLVYKLDNSDTISKNKSDLFYIKLPDSLKNHIHIVTKNGHLVRTKNDTIFRMLSINGMKYSHTIIDTTFEALLEGICEPSNSIELNVQYIKSKKIILHNKFIVK